MSYASFKSHACYVKIFSVSIVDNMLIVSTMFILEIDQELKEYVENHIMTHPAVGIFFVSFQKVSYSKSS